MSSGLPIYAARADVRTYGISTTQAADALVDDLLDTSSRAIDDFCGNSDYGLGGYFAAPVTTTITVGDLRQPLVVLPRPFSAISSVLVNGQPLGATMQSTVQAAPTPTTTAFNVATGKGTTVMTSRPIFVGGVQARILSVSGDSVLLTLPLPSAPSAGTAVVQWPFIVEDWGLRVYFPTVIDADGFPVRSATPLGFSWRGFGFGGAAPYGSQVDVTATFGYATVPQPVKQACILVTAFLCQGQGQTLMDPSLYRVSVEGYTVESQRRTPRGPGDSSDIDLKVSTGVIEADRLLRRYQIQQLVA